MIDRRPCEEMIVATIATLNGLDGIDNITACSGCSTGRLFACRGTGVLHESD
jgi:hypothetical protein